MREIEDGTPVALYARVSSERQDVDLSVAAQLGALRKYAVEKGCVVAREYVDEAESGLISHRPQFRKMLNDASQPETPFREILVWKFSRFTRRREHAVAFKSMLRKKGVRVVSITEPADDSPTGKLMEAIIEGFDGYYSLNMGQDIRRGLREAASRGFWMTSRAPYGYRKVRVQDGAKLRSRLELDPPADAVVRRIFDLALEGCSTLDIAKVLNGEGISGPREAKWQKTTVHKVLGNEAYAGTLIYGVGAMDGSEPVRVEDAFPAIVMREEFGRVARSLSSKAPSRVHPRRAASPYLLSGLVSCQTCGKALVAHEAKGGRYTYYVCHSLLKRGRGTCRTPRLNSKRFERLIVDQLRENILTESNIRKLVRMLDEEMDGEAREHRRKLESVEAELADVRRRLSRVWNLVETTDLEPAEATSRIREHRERQERLELAADEARRRLSGRRVLLDNAETIAVFARDMSEYLESSDLTETKSFIRSFVKEIVARPGRATINYTMPIPGDGASGLRDASDIALRSPVINTVPACGDRGTRTPNLGIANAALSQLSYIPRGCRRQHCGPQDYSMDTCGQAASGRPPG